MNEIAAVETMQAWGLTYSYVGDLLNIPRHSAWYAINQSWSGPQHERVRKFMNALELATPMERERPVQYLFRVAKELRVPDWQTADIL